MSLYAQFAAVTTGKVAHVARSGGVNDYGAPSFSSSQASTYDAYWEPQSRMITTEDGREVQSRGRVYVLSTSATIRTEDWVAFDDSTNPIRLLDVSPMRDLDGQHHIEIDY